MHSTSAVTSINRRRMFGTSALRRLLLLLLNGSRAIHRKVTDRWREISLIARMRILRVARQLAGVSVLDAGREVFRITIAMQGYPRKLALRRRVVGELAVEPAKLRDDRLRYRVPYLLAAGHSGSKLDGDREVAVAVGVLPGLHDELAGDPRRDRRLLQAHGDVLRVNVRAVVRHRELRAAEHVHER